jgi:hypothetical protein
MNCLLFAIEMYDNDNGLHHATILNIDILFTILLFFIIITTIVESLFRLL